MLGTIRQILGYEDDPHGVPLIGAEDVRRDIGKCLEHHSQITALLNKFEELDRDQIALVRKECEGFDDFTTSLSVMQQPLQRCAELERKFPLVEFDNAVTRKVKIGSSEKTVECQIVWHTKLPAKPFTKLIVRSDGNKYECTAKTPAPTAAAKAAMDAHGHEFDHLELWWVPKDIMVQEIPKPDPILIGAVQYRKDKFYYFELHRWIDESVENAWWSREGY